MKRNLIPNLSIIENIEKKQNDCHLGLTLGFFKCSSGLGLNERGQLKIFSKSYFRPASKMFTRHSSITCSLPTHYLAAVRSVALLLCTKDRFVSSYNI